MPTVENTPPHQIKTLREIEEETEDRMNQFIFMIWTPNPNTGRVKIILDEGTVKFVMKPTKFLSVMKDILCEPTCTKEVYNNFIKIQESLNEYGGMFYYDRSNNFFRPLSEGVQQAITSVITGEDITNSIESILGRTDSQFNMIKDNYSKTSNAILQDGIVKATRSKQKNKIKSK